MKRQFLFSYTAPGKGYVGDITITLTDHNGVPLLNRENIEMEEAE